MYVTSYVKFLNDCLPPVFHVKERVRLLSLFSNDPDSGNCFHLYDKKYDAPKDEEAKSWESEIGEEDEAITAEESETITNNAWGTLESLHL